MLLDTDVINGILKEELGEEKYQGWVEGQRLFKAITRYHTELFERDDESDDGHVEQEPINKYSLGRSLSPGVMCASEVQRLRDQERINAMSGKLKNKLACETDPGDYAPTAEYANGEKGPLGILRLAGTKPGKWVDQEYIKSLIEKEQATDKAAYELAKTLDQKYKNGDWENGE